MVVEIDIKVALICLLLLGTVCVGCIYNCLYESPD